MDADAKCNGGSVLINQFRASEAQKPILHGLLLLTDHSTTNWAELMHDNCPLLQKCLFPKVL